MGAFEDALMGGWPSDMAQQAREVASNRVKQSTAPGVRQEGMITGNLVSQGEKIKDAIENVVSHPEDLVGTGGLGTVVPLKPNQFITPNSPSNMNTTGGFRNIVESLNGELDRLYDLLSNEFTTRKQIGSDMNKISPFEQRIGHKINEIRRQLDSMTKKSISSFDNTKTESESDPLGLGPLSE